jgi:hypothetical protein
VWPFDINFDYNNNIIGETMKQCMFVLMDNGVIQRRSEIKKQDTIDVSSWAKENLGDDTSSMPQMVIIEDFKKVLADYWYLGIPPILDGVIKINRDRYLSFEVKDINIDEKKYDIEIADYACDKGVWMFNGFVQATIAYENNDVRFYYSDFSLYDLLKGTFVDYTLEPHLTLSNEMYNKLNDFVLPFVAKCKKEDEEKGNSMGQSILSHFFCVITKVNSELMHGPKPKAIRNNSKSNVKTVVDKVPEKNPRPQIIRTLSSGITIKSVKVPKAPTIEIIRHYKVASWNVRGHMRRYKNGKVIYIAPTVAKRKEFKNTDAPKRQTIIVSGLKGTKLTRKEDET